MKSFFSEIFSSGPKTAGVIMFIALIFVISFYNDNKATLAVISRESEISSQEEIIKLRNQIEELEIKLETCKKERGN